MMTTKEKVARYRGSEKDRPSRLFFMLLPRSSARRRWSSEGGFSLIEMVVVLALLLFIMQIFFMALTQMARMAERESIRSVAISTARNGAELVAQTLRNTMVQFNTVPGTPFGINFDLDDGAPLVRDGLLFYIDENRSALFYSFDDSGQPFTAGLDDVNADGMADLFGIGLLPQDDDNDGVPDFIDLDRDGVADDIDNDGNPDISVRLVLVRFNNINDVVNPALWRAGRTLARNLYVRRLNAAGPLTASNLDTFQFLAKSTTALLSDANGDGVLDEQELGNLTSVDGIINDPAEINMVDAVVVTLHVADLVQTGAQRSIVREDFSTEISPRSLVLSRRNGLVGFADPADPAHIN